MLIPSCICIVLYITNKEQIVDIYRLIRKRLQHLNSYCTVKIREINVHQTAKGGGFCMGIREEEGGGQKKGLQNRRLRQAFNFLRKRRRRQRIKLLFSP